MSKLCKLKYAVQFIKILTKSSGKYLFIQENLYTEQNIYA